MLLPVKIFSFCWLVLLASPAFSDLDEFLGGQESAEEVDIKAWKFREDVLDLPRYPNLKAIQSIAIDAPDARFQYFIDPASIQVGIEQIEVRITTIVRAVSGYDNVFFEGFRCDTREYKTYAYGVSGEKFYAVLDPQWKGIGKRGGTGLDYRQDLVTAYLCDIYGNALSKREILQVVEYPEDIPD